MVYESGHELYRTWWKRGKSQSPGYHKAYFAKTPDGDILQVDYNFHENLVKFHVQPFGEKGKTYTSTIKRGIIIRERDIFNAQNISIKKKILPFKEVFSCIPDEDLLQSIGGNYGISSFALGRKKSDGSSDRTGDYLDKEERERESFFQRLLRKRRNSGEPSFLEKYKERALDDFHDAVLGISLGVAVYFHFFDLIATGALLGGSGIFFGGMDWIVRDRKPLFLKIFIFLLIGTYFFYTGYTRD